MRGGARSLLSTFNNTETEMKREGNMVHQKTTALSPLVTVKGVSFMST